MAPLTTSVKGASPQALCLLAGGGAAAGQQQAAEHTAQELAKRWPGILTP